MYYEPEETEPYDFYYEAREIALFLGDGTLNDSQMKQVFFDLSLIRELFEDELICLSYSVFIHPRELAQYIHETKYESRCMIYPREIIDGMSYLFVNDKYLIFTTRKTKHSNLSNESGYRPGDSRTLVYHYFEVISDEVYYYGHHTPQIAIPDEWWYEAEKNISLYEDY